MRVSAKIKRTGGHDFQYPVILETDTTIVWFVAPKKGTQLNGSEAGQYREDWADPEFYPWRVFNGTILLENLKEPSHDQYQ